MEFILKYHLSLGFVRSSAGGVQTGGVLSVKLIRLNFKGQLQVKIIMETPKIIQFTHFERSKQCSD